MAERLERFLVKFVIVLVVFPVLVLAFLQLSKLPPLLLSLVLPASWANAVGMAALILGLIAGVAGAFLICRKIWPRATNGRSGDLSSKEV